MSWRLSCLIPLVCMLMIGSQAGSPIDSNLYADGLFSTLVPLYARSLGLENASVPNCAFNVASTSVTNRDVNVELHGGRLLGLVIPGLARRGQCSAPGWLGLNVTLGCYVSLDNAHLSYAGSAKGDSLLNTNRSIVLQAMPVNASALLEVTSTPGGAPRVRTWALQPFTLAVGTSPKLSLNAARQATFDKEASKCVLSALSNILLVAYREALERSVSGTKLPLP
uniref:Putative secreted protein n=1 Tax=Amblyomma americanum TaxID=6943 RepID=A0A0C9SEC9_AMBAM